MPIDATTGVSYALHGPTQGQPLLITLPLMASFGDIFGHALEPVLKGYLDRLTDRSDRRWADVRAMGVAEEHEDRRPTERGKRCRQPVRPGQLECRRRLYDRLEERGEVH